MSKSIAHVIQHVNFQFYRAFLALSYLEKPAKDDKYVNKREGLLIHQTISVFKIKCQEEKMLATNCCESKFYKKTFLDKSVKARLCKRIRSRELAFYIWRYKKCDCERS